jgi:hypothetical protein
MSHSPILLVELMLAPVRYGSALTMAVGFAATVIYTFQGPDDYLDIFAAAKTSVLNTAAGPSARVREWRRNSQGVQSDARYLHVLLVLPSRCWIVGSKRYDGKEGFSL